MVDIKPDEGHQPETINEAELLNSPHKNESILENVVQDTLDGSEVEEDGIEPPSPFSESAVPKKSKTKEKRKRLWRNAIFCESVAGG